MMEKATKKLSKRFGVHVSTKRQIIYEWKAFGMTASQTRNGGLRKITVRPSRHLVWQALANPAVLSAVLKGSLDNVRINVYICPQWYEI